MNRRRDIIWVALVAVALAVPAAIADEAGSAGLKKDVKKALALAKKAKKKAGAANKKAKNALEVAETTSKQQGPQGPKGDKGDAGDPGAPGADGADLLGAFIGSGTPNASLRFSTLTSGGNFVSDVRGDLSPNRQVTFSDFGAEVVAAPQVGNFLTLTVLVDGADTALTCSIAAGATACSSAATVAILPRSRLSIRLDQHAVNDETLNAGWSVTVS